MAVQRRMNANKAKQVRKDKNGADKEGSGDDKHMLVGATGSGSDQRHYRSFVTVNWNWASVKTLVKAELVMMVEDDSTHFSLGSKPRIRVQRATEGWSDGTGGENKWTHADYEVVSSTGGVEKDLAINPSTGKPQDEAWLFVDVTTLIKPVVPKAVKYVDGSSGGGATNYGFVIRSPGEETDTKQRAIFYSWHATDSAKRPYLLITYDPVNRAPVAPTLLNPGTTGVSFGDTFEGTHSDPDLDPMAARDIEVWKSGETGDAGKVAVWSINRDAPSLLTAGSDETATGRFSVPLSLAAGALKLQTAYEWRARTKDPAGLWGPFSAVRALKIDSSAPTIVATVLPPLNSMAEGLFGGKYTDPESDPVAQFELQMRSLAAHTDAAFSDPATFIWHTGVTIPTGDEVTSGVIARPYGGQQINLGSFTYRIRAQDDSGAWSLWSYADFQLLHDYNPDPGDITLTTQIGRNAPVRIALYKMGTNRGIGALIGYVDDPIDLGGSAYLNGGGELYFSLPALHPYCPSIEAHQTHYHVEQYYGDRYAVRFAGIITDFDADTDTVTFYGTDYLGLLQTAVDERYNPEKAEQAAPTGSKYVDKTIDTIIRDQLTYHKGLPNSPVGFITIGSMTVLAERATIYSTYAEALPFIVGLIDSHKQGTGREARFYARPTNATYTSWEWALVDNWGKDRPNIELEYGGLLNDFRVVALGDFATRVLSVGQKRGEVKVYRAVGTGGLNEAQWGRRAKTAFFQDIIDQNDLQRRANENATTLSKVGKRIALAIRADMLSPFDGWDLGDNIKIRIERGVVDTAQYGSGGYWTIYGVEWRYYPDGHTDMTFTVMPKKTATPPDPDLIPSINPGVPIEWQVGYGVPTTYGEPPINTPEPEVFAAPLADAEDVWRYRTGYTTPAAGQIKVNPGESQLLISKTSDGGWDRSGELLQLLVGSRLRLRSQGDLLRVWQVTAVGDAGTHLTVTVLPLLSIGGYPANNQPVLASLRTVGSYSFYPPSTETVQAQHYQDLNTGCVYELDESTGIYTEVYCPPTGGGTAPPPVDTVPPGPPTLSTLASSVVTDVDGSTVVELRATVVHPADPDMFSTAVQFTYENDENPDPSLALPIWTNASVVSIGLESTVAVLRGVPGNKPFWARANSRDISGNVSVWSDVLFHITAKDEEAPSVPSGVDAIAGYRSVGLTWDPSAASDLMFNEVRYAPDNGAGAPDTTASTWSPPAIRARVNTMVIGDLIADPTTPYWFQVRSVDYSGNVATSDADATAVDYLASPEAGWSALVTATPTLIGATDVAFNEVIANIIETGEIDAGTILSGTLKIDATGDGADGIEVWNGGVKVGFWDETGLYIGKNTEGLPPDLASSDYVRITDAGLYVYLDGQEQSAITPEGINATAINFGRLPGGMNLIKNSSFELAGFSSSVPTAKTWTAAADWTGTQQSNANTTNGATALSVTGTTF